MITKWANFCGLDDTIAPLRVAVVILSFLTVLAVAHDPPQHFTNQWVVRIKGGPEEADRLAREHGYQNLGELQGFPNTFLMKKHDHPKRSKRDASHLTKRLADDAQVIWAEQQFAKQRVKRGILHKSVEMSKRSRENWKRFEDELWTQQWYLHDSLSHNSKLADLHVTNVWDMGYTGKGIVVTILDDGLEWNHTDIAQNYDPKASWDANDNDPDPFPRYDEFDSNNHGTRCAGEVAMMAGNKKCGVGAAYNAKIGGVRMLDGDVSDVIESVSLSYNIGHIDIYSSSWGPSDDGMTVDGPHRLALEAILKGINQGRHGKGVIYVWASGNGGSKDDNCNCDGYTSSIYTLSIGSATQEGNFPWYGEKCASTMAVAYSSGTTGEEKISTIDLHNQCTNDHSGTSAAAPLAAGILALVLEANPNLTWRDMQHLVVWTSDYEPLKNNVGWRRNKAGLLYSSRFGFGLLNAEMLVKQAVNWTTVPEKTICEVESTSKFPMPLTSGQSVEAFFVTNGCKNTPNEINYLEHVQIIADIDYTKRGNLDIYLISPSGTVTMLLSTRDQDYYSLGFENWAFLTVHMWGENPSGEWKLIVRDKFGKNQRGALKNASLVLHGTKKQPQHMKDGPRKYRNENEVKKIIDPKPEYEEKKETSKEGNTHKLPYKSGMLNWSDIFAEKLRHISQLAEAEEAQTNPDDYDRNWMPKMDESRTSYESTDLW